MTIDRKKIEVIAKELGSGIKSEKDLSDLSREIVKITVEAALGAEMVSGVQPISSFSLT